MYTVDELNDRLIDLAFSEDIGDGDHTTLCCIPEDAMGKSRLLIKEEGILAGMRIAKEIFHRFDSTMQVEQLMEDGAHVKPGDVPMIVTGKVRSLLQTERLMLNVMQRMSGIATMTNKYVERFGLFDMILLKDNHIDFAGGIANALDRCAAYQKEKGLNLKVEIECRSFDEINQVMAHGGADRIMLDNFSVENTKKAVELIDHKFETESSGGITYDTLRDYAECGVDFISVGALTHSVKGLDMSFKAC